MSILGGSHDPCDHADVNGRRMRQAGSGALRTRQVTGHV